MTRCRCCRLIALDAPGHQRQEHFGRAQVAVDVVQMALGKKSPPSPWKSHKASLEPTQSLYGRFPKLENHNIDPKNHNIDPKRV